MSIELRESTTTAPVRKGSRWRTIVATPGQGSSGYYSEEVLKRDAEKIISPGGQSFINHDMSRNPKDLIGYFPEGSYWSEEDNAVVADLEVFSHWKDFVTEVAPHVGMSIFALGEADSEGNVTAIIEDDLNGCDLVARPGLKGSKLDKLYESAVAGSGGKPSTTVVQENEGMMMDQEIKDAFKALTDQISALVAEKDATIAAEAQAKVDTDAVAQALESYSAAVDAVEKAELLDVQRAEILEAAKRGEEVAPLIESAIKVRDAAVEAARAKVAEEGGAGRILGESADFKIGAWK